jgi:hypothetical protein
MIPIIIRAEKINLGFAVSNLLVSKSDLTNLMLYQKLMRVINPKIIAETLLSQNTQNKKNGSNRYKYDAWVKIPSSLFFIVNLELPSLFV